MKFFPHRFGFTLMEVNLAIFIMATGVLAMVALYPLAYRENQQSKEDVKGAIMADAVLNQLTAALSSRNTTWQEWHSAVQSAVNATGNKGWMKYCDEHNNVYTPKKKSQITSQAKQIFDALGRAYKDSGSVSWPVTGNDYAVALVAQWGRMPVLARAGSGSKVPVTYQQTDHSRVSIGLRCCRNSSGLFSAPIYYTEVHFQGDQKDLK